jgi:phenylacetate-CoA ligase
LGGPVNENDINIIFNDLEKVGMLLERADFADLKVLAAHRQHLWEKQRDYVAANSLLHRRAWAGAKVPYRLEEFAEFP